MEAVISQYGLKQELATLAKRDQLLALAPLSGRDPDQALTDVPYVKGAWFLSFLERRFGRERFATFLRGYFDHFAFQRISSDDFRSYLHTLLLAATPGVVSTAEVHAWVYPPGIPKFAQPAHSARFDAVAIGR